VKSEGNDIKYLKGLAVYKKDKLNQHLEDRAIYLQQMIRLRSHISSLVMVCMGDPGSTLSDVTVQILPLAEVLEISIQLIKSY
jgi:hypothetical protein